VEVRVRNGRPVVTRIEVSPPPPVRPGEQVTLTAIAVDSDPEDVLRYEWRKVTQAGAFFPPADSRQNQAILITEANVLREYVLEVVAEDGFEASAAATVTVATGNGPPAVTAPSDVQNLGHFCNASGICEAPRTGSTLRVQGEVFDAEGDSLTIAFRRKAGSGPASASVEIGPLEVQGTQVGATVTFRSGADGRVAGSYDLELCARDALHADNCKPFRVTVANEAPVASPPPDFAVPHVATVGPVYAATFTLVGDGRDPESPAPATNLSYTWTRPGAGEAADPGASIDMVQVDPSDPTHRRVQVTISKDCTQAGSCVPTPGLIGEYVFHLQLMDLQGDTGSGVVRVRVGNRRPPTSNENATSGLFAGDPVTVSHG
jgi:hypothetical protein